MPADGLAPNCARPSADTVLIIRIYCFSSDSLWILLISCTFLLIRLSLLKWLMMTSDVCYILDVVDDIFFSPCLTARTAIFPSFLNKILYHFVNTINVSPLRSGLNLSEGVLSWCLSTGGPSPAALTLPMAGFLPNHQLSCWTSRPSQQYHGWTMVQY